MPDQDIDTLDIDALLARHRATFGSARMEADDDADGDAGDDEDTGDDDAADDDTDTGDDDGKADADKALGPKGEKALTAEKEKRRTAQAELRKFKALGLTPEQIKALQTGGAKADADKPDVESLQRDADAKAQGKANERILRSEVKALATGKLADPADAYKFLDLTDFEVDGDGNVDEDEIADAIEELISKKPYLAAVAQGDGKRFKGAADGGTRKETRPSQLGKADMARMSPEQIEEARVAGRFDDLLSGKSS